MARRRAGPIAIVLAAAAACGLARAEVEDLTLYQRTGRAALVVRARALSDATRRPEVLVLETLKGSFPERTRLVVIPHAEDNTRPTPWLRREIFRKGQESVLFLEPYVDDFGRPADVRFFKVMGARDGKLDLPPEGADALLNAVRRFAAVQALGQLETQARALREMLHERNPYLVEAALSECRRFHLGEAQDAENLVPLVEHARPDLRRGALALLAQILAAPHLDGAPDFPRQRVFEAVAARARLDEDPGVESAAVSALEAFQDEAALALLDGIGAADPSQQVRYEALVGARRLRDALK